jgi:hypothetical protein
LSELSAAALHRFAPRRAPWSPAARGGFAASALTWLGLMAYVALAKLLLDRFLPNAFSDPTQKALFSWARLGLIGAAGLAGVWLSHRTGFPGAWDARVSSRQRLLIPAALGLGFAAALIAFDRVTGFAHQAAAAFGLERQFTDYPSMFLIFTAAPVIVEVVYRLVPIPLGLWLVSGLALRGRGQAPLFWALAVLTSLLEPLSQTPWALRQGLVAVFVVLFAHGFLFNLGQAALFRRYGFLAAIAMRAVYYLPWHVLYVH